MAFFSAHTDSISFLFFAATVEKDERVRKSFYAKSNNVLDLRQRVTVRVYIYRTAFNAHASSFVCMHGKGK